MTIQKQSKFDIKKPRRNPRVAVLLCDCGQTLSDALDFPAITAAVRKLPGVAQVLCLSDLCQPTGIAQCVSALSDAKITHVLVAACAPVYYQAVLAQALDQFGFFISRTNIREHCAWVHSDPDAASEKALRLIKLATQRQRLANHVVDRTVRLNQRVLVIGAGLAGMQTSLCLAHAGHKVALITRSDSLGGRAVRQTILPDAAARATDLASKVQANRKITVLTNTELRSLTGQFGHFQAHLSPTDVALSCGLVVVATGQAQLSDPPGPGLLSFEDLSLLLRKNRLSSLTRIGLILDLRDQQDCAATRACLKLARRARELWLCETYVFCQHLRVAGSDQEQDYQDARQAGVLVVKTASAPQIIEQVGSVCVTGTDEQTRRPFALTLDLLAAADIPKGDNGQASLNSLLRTGKTVAGLAQRDNVFLLPVDSGRKGILFAGSCRVSMEWPQTLADGLAAAEQAHLLLTPSSIRIAAQRAQVDPSKCAFCLTCYRTCPHGAIDIDQDGRAAVISPVMCQACGVCASECPAKAIDLVDYSDDQLCTTTGFAGGTVIFACENSALLAADRAGLGRMAYSANTTITPVCCVGRVDPVHVLRALQAGARKVLVLGCHEQACKYMHGINRAKARIERLRDQFTQLGLEPDRVQIGTLMAADAGRFVEFVNGPNAPGPRVGGL
ncbi:MAG: hydrogenase iron-sulfur subunit [Actinobacteria bacterium]|nr:hydrogenase iron-sulfur subunit [Actinomycetota bacterium]